MNLGLYADMIQSLSPIYLTCSISYSSEFMLFTIAILNFGYDLDMGQMKEKFAKLLLGEDMSGGGKGVSSALTLSNAITNLAGSWILNFLIL